MINGITFPDYDRNRGRSSDRGGKSSRHTRPSAREVVDESSSAEAKRLNHESRRSSKPHTSRKHSKQYGHRPKSRKAREVQGSPSQSDDDQQSGSESQGSDKAPEAKYASVYHTIDVRHTKYASYSSSSSSDSERRSEKSATTKAKTK